VRGSAEVKAAQKIPNALVLDLNPGMGQAEGGGLVEAARTGQTPPQLTLPKAGKAAAVPGWPDDFGSDEGTRIAGVPSPARRAQPANAPPPMPASAWSGQSSSVGRPVQAKSGWLRGFAWGMAAGLVLACAVVAIWQVLTGQSGITSIAHNEARRTASNSQPDRQMQPPSSPSENLIATTPAKEPAKPTPSLPLATRPSAQATEHKATEVLNKDSKPPERAAEQDSKAAAGNENNTGKDEPAPKTRFDRFSLPETNVNELERDLTTDFKTKSRSYTLNLIGLKASPALRGFEAELQIIPAEDRRVLRVVIQRKGAETLSDFLGEFRVEGVKLRFKWGSQFSNESEGKLGVEALRNSVLEVNGTELRLALRDMKRVPPIIMQLPREILAPEKSQYDFVISRTLDWPIRPEGPLFLALDDKKLPVLRVGRDNFSATHIEPVGQEFAISFDKPFVFPGNAAQYSYNNVRIAVQIESDNTVNRYPKVKAVLQCATNKKVETSKEIQAKITERTKELQTTQKPERREDLSKQIEGLKEQERSLRKDGEALKSYQLRLDIPQGIIYTKVGDLRIDLYEIAD
jgi:hypothetical protein